MIEDTARGQKMPFSGGYLSVQYPIRFYIVQFQWRAAGFPLNGLKLVIHPVEIIRPAAKLAYGPRPAQHMPAFGAAFFSHLDLLQSPVSPIPSGGTDPG